MLFERLADAIQHIFAEEGFAVGRCVFSRSRKREWLQFQITEAIRLAHEHKVDPHDLATRMATKLRALNVVEACRVDGPGFINFSLTDDAIDREVHRLAQDVDAHKASILGDDTKTIFLDYGGPNIAKAMHVGHLRSAIIGDTLRRMMNFLGVRTIADVHLGDWGMPIGLVIAALLYEVSKAGEISGEAVAAAHTIDDIERLTDLYTRAARRSDAAFQQKAREITARLQDGDPQYRKIWAHLRSVSVAAIRNEYERLNVHFDLWLGESDAYRNLEPLIGRLLRAGLAHKDKGAIIIDVNDVETDDGPPPPLMLRKTDGAVTYAATDLATLEQRLRDFAPDAILYVVDQRQQLHFRQLFNSAAKIGLIENDTLNCEHIGFGTIQGKDGKPLKSRTGDVARLAELIDEIESIVRSRIFKSRATDGDYQGADEVVRTLTIATIRFADLINNRTTDYVFDPEAFAALEGKTGCYLCYSAVRAAALLRRHPPSHSAYVAGTFQSEEQRQLALQLLDFPNVVTNACEKRSPSLLCEHLYDLARRFNALYHAHHVGSEVESGKKIQLITLIMAADHQLRLGLGLIGITVPQWM